MGPTDPEDIDLYGGHLSDLCALCEGVANFVSPARH